MTKISTFCSFSLLHLIVILLFTKQVHANTHIKKGVLDLRNESLNDERVIKLNGEWEFYWKQLLTPESFKDHNSNKEATQFVTMPITFGKSEFMGEPLPDFGYATYRLLIIGRPTSDEQLAIYYKRLFSAARIWINGKLIDEIGIVGTTRDEEIALMRSGVHHFACKDTIEILLQISNFHHKKGGIVSPLEFGKSHTIQRKRIHLIGVDSFLLGVLIIISFYQLGIFIYRTKAYASLNFSLFGFAMATYLVLNNEVIATQILPYISFEIFQKLNFGAIICRLFFWGTFLSYIFPNEISPSIRKWLGYPTLAITLFILLTPAYIFTYILPLVIAISGITITYLLYGVVLTATRKREGGLYTLIGTTAMFSAGVNDILHEMLIIHTSFLLPFGVLIFFIAQSFMLAMHFAKSFTEVEGLSVELSMVNENLEGVVEVRTREIAAQKTEIEKQHDEIKKRSEQQKIQNDKLRRQQSELKDSISYAKNIQRAVLPPDEIFKAAFSDFFVLYRPKDIVSGDFYWCKAFEKEGETFYVFATADCTGHGVPGAFLSMLGISLLNEIVPNRKYIKANRILEEMRKELKMALRQTTGFRKRKDGIDMSVCVINPKKLTLQFSGAYTNMYLQRGEDLNEIKGVPCPIGVHPKEIPFVNHDFDLQQNDTIYMLSDGYTDQLGGAHTTKFLRKNFRELLLTIKDKGMTAQKQILSDTLDGWSDNIPQVDDVLVLGERI